MSEYLRLKGIIEQTFKMEFVSDDQRKAVFASLAEGGGEKLNSFSEGEREGVKSVVSGYIASYESLDDVGKKTFIDTLRNFYGKRGNEVADYFLSQVSKRNIKNKYPGEFQKGLDDKKYGFSYINPNWNKDQLAAYSEGYKKG